MFDFNVLEEISLSATIPYFLLFYLVDINYRTKMSDDDGLIRLNFVAYILYRVFIYSLLNSEIISQFIPYQIAQSDDTIVFF